MIWWQVLIAAIVAVVVAPIAAILLVPKPKERPFTLWPFDDLKPPPRVCVEFVGGDCWMGTCAFRGDHWVTLSDARKVNADGTETPADGHVSFPIGTVAMWQELG